MPYCITSKLSSWQNLAVIVNSHTFYSSNWDISVLSYRLLQEVISQAGWVQALSWEWWNLIAHVALGKSFYLTLNISFLICYTVLSLDIAINHIGQNRAIKCSIYLGSALNRLVGQGNKFDFRYCILFFDFPSLGIPGLEEVWRAILSDNIVCLTVFLAIGILTHWTGLGQWLFWFSSYWYADSNSQHSRIYLPSARQFLQTFGCSTSCFKG